MDKCLYRHCQLKDDLEEVDDPFPFLAKNYTIEGVLDNLDHLSQKELKCACCLFGSTLLRLSEETSVYRRLLKRINMLVGGCKGEL